MKMDYSKLEITYIGSEILSSKSSEISEISNDVKIFAKNMIDMMYKYNGVGLAAPQVGINEKLVVIDIKDYASESMNTPGEILLMPQMPIVLINPQITAFSKDTSVMDEGCLSIPEIYAPVERPVDVNLSAELLSGEKINVHCGGFLARVLQHEIDHLDGVLFVDRVAECDRKRVNSKIKKLQKRLKKKK